MMDNEQRIMEYMNKYEHAWPQDISQNLKIDFGEVMKITTELIKKGLIEVK